MALPIGPRPGAAGHPADGPKRMYSGVFVNVGEFGPPVMQIHCLPAGTSGRGTNLPSWIFTVEAQMYLPATFSLVEPLGPVGSVCWIDQSMGSIIPSAS